MRARSSAHSVQGVRWGCTSASTVVGALNARSAVGHKYASTVVDALGARSAVGHRYASTAVSALDCKECGGKGICEHGRARSPVQGVPRGETVVVRSYSISSIDYKQYTAALGLYFLPGVDLVGGLLRVEVLVSLAALGFAGVDFFAGFFAGVVAFLGVDFLPAFFSATAP